MNCYKHNEITAVSQCKCGRGMCSECTNQFSFPCCQYCKSHSEKTAETNNKTLKKRVSSSIYLELFLTLIAGILGLFIFKDSALGLPDDGPILSMFTKFIPFIIAAGFVSGWHTLSSL